LIAEITGAIAVVVSLIYVGLSVNQNTNAIMVANHQALVAMDQDTNGWLRDPEFAEILEIAINDVDQLSASQSRQYFTFVADKINAWEFAFITHENGMMKDNIWSGWDAYYRSLIDQKEIHDYWGRSKAGFSPAFVSYVESAITATR
jgi:hypothetical protein